MSIDLNYRKKLWNYGVIPPEVMRGLVAKADVVVANEEDIQKCLGMESSAAGDKPGSIHAEAYKALTDAVREAFPNLGAVAVTLRESRSADRNGWSVVLNGASGFIVSRSYDIDDIVDRVGGTASPPDWSTACSISRLTRPRPWSSPWPLPPSSIQSPETSTW